MNRLLQHWLTEQSEKYPDKIAITMGDKKLSYQELEIASTRLARTLKENGCKKGDRVGFYMPKSPQAYISIFGILKADCLYVPLDPEGPFLRTVKMINKGGIRFILATSKVENKLNNILTDKHLSHSLAFGMLDDGEAVNTVDKPRFSFKDLEVFSSTSLEYKNSSNDPAHLLFTSGSTGDPKGVINTHSNVIHFIDWATEYFGINNSDRISGHPPLHFDMSSLDLYTAISTGAELFPVPREMNIHPKFMCEFIRKNRLTQWFSVPSVLSLMSKFDVLEKNDFQKLRRLMWCGEVMPTSTLIYLMKKCPHISITNLYGPTETTIASSYYTVPDCPEDELEEIPIGRPCRGEKLHVLDKQMNRTEPGTVGDLYISGVGVGLGYWEDPEKTDEVFKNNPFSSEAGNLIYKTGDLARFGQDGLIYFHGRSDTQIKSRGYRIELGEIENAVNSISDILETAIVAVPTNDFDSKAVCCAYVPKTDSNTDTTDIKIKLSELLPDYMIPTRWRRYDALPKNKNGKVDRKTITENFQKNASKTG